MNRSYRIARISDIDIKIHITFVVIPILFGLEWGGRAQGATGFAFGVLIALALFACVTLHELGHSLVAQLFRIPVRLVAVYAGERFLGLVSREDLREALSVMIFEKRRLEPAVGGA